MTAEYMRRWRSDNPIQVAHAREQKRARRWALSRLRELHRDEYDSLIAQWWAARARVEARQMREAS